MPQYQGVWTLEAQAQALTKQQWVTDPNFRNTTLLLQADGTGSGSQNQSFLDSSTNNFFIARFGNTTQGSFSPFSQAPGYWSNNFVRSGSQFLSISNSTGDFNFGTGALTIECFVNLASMPSGSGYPASYWLFGGGPLNSNPGIDLYITNTQIGFNLVDFVSPTAIGTHGMSVGNWYHVAVVRGGGSNQTVSIYVNGIRVATASSVTATAATTSNISISAAEPVGSTSGNLDGYISNYRVVKGSAVYDPTLSTLTVPNSPLTSITNTVLLTCQANRFVDSNTQTTAKTITTNGTPSVQAFGPFAPALQWTPDVVGGSGYFDGSDYLSVSQAAGNFGTSNFSVECFYCNSAAYSGTVYPRIVSKSIVTSAPSGAWGLSTRNGTTDEVYFAYYNASFVNVGTGINVNDFAWHHLLVTYDGSRIRVFVDGILRGNAVPTISSFGTATGDPVLIGYQSREGNYINGYVSGLRITNGSIPTSYQTASTTNGTTIFTPPTAPPTTSSQGAANVSLLTNYTNAGIYDGKMANNLETVGNAQVATSPVKYGSGSMYFDGNGDYLTSANTQNVAFGTGDFTVEMWVYPLSATAVYYLYDSRTVNTNPGIQWYMNSNSTMGVAVGTTTVLTTAAVMTANEWQHIAITKENGFWRIYRNGILLTSGTNTTSLTDTGLTIACSFNQKGATTTDKYNGYMDDFRITKGVARYIANFTPPQQALPRQ